jgi:hypothetical protein
VRSRGDFVVHFVALLALILPLKYVVLLIVVVSLAVVFCELLWCAVGVTEP